MSTNLQPKTVLANQLVMTKVVGVSSVPNNIDNIVNVASDETNNVSNILSDEISSEVSNEVHSEINSEINNIISDKLNNVTTSLSTNNEKATKDSFDDKTNSSKPNLVKNYQNRNNSQRYENKRFRNNDRFNGNNRFNGNTENNGNKVGNGKVSSINNQNNNANANSANVFNRQVDVVPSTFARIEQIYNRVCEGFVYRPNLGFVVNAIIKTGKFKPEIIADNICTVFCEKQARTTRKTSIYLTKDNLEKCRQIQAEVKAILDMDIDIHPVLNSMIYTGTFYVDDIRNAVRNFFMDKRKNSSYQGSNSYQKADSYQKPNSYDNSKPYQKSRSYQNSRSNQRPRPYQKAKPIN
ncbi:MAG: hypothetical protein WAQ98_10880 [Blastocatellia bacterium]